MQSSTIVIWFTLVSLTQAGFTHMEKTIIDGIPNSPDFDSCPFTRIGQKFYYIEDEKILNWFRAAHACRQLRGHLVSIDSATEMDALSAYLGSKGSPEHLGYWIAGNDLGEEGSYSSIATGSPLIFARWAPGQPDNNNNTENCMQLLLRDEKYEMSGSTCTNGALFICQANTPRTVFFTVW